MADHFWADTNIVIRHVTGEPEHQAKIQKIIRQVEGHTFVLHIHPIVVAECCYVLEAIYEFEKMAIAKALQIFLASSGVETENKEIVHEALNLYAEKNVDFEDAYLAVVARRSSIPTVMTFDRKHYKRLQGEFCTPETLVQ